MKRKKKERKREERVGAEARRSLPATSTSAHAHEGKEKCACEAHVTACLFFFFSRSQLPPLYACTRIHLFAHLLNYFMLSTLQLPTSSHLSRNAKKKKERKKRLCCDSEWRTSTSSLPFSSRAVSCRVSLFLFLLL
ncbi:hypothetical protein, unlikely [Trypanosoma brucei gambiense DAL972]|uniref:Uncharacterized protein n=1 Tax=Trypanosoma brucei gambiense (strain MHOM/CI/86/DAL972) TaxID=679716 RepID=C9ZIC1_TRYB9|nr:hypothetical protein, unlikely [Trypanosoma brucei gambiense DAL972]CBH08913.1 hypothetical protein, unlikely [Trypanosoma brucei gambiense DAL972]|eukprot:XP_011771354.1 hypothetical protein, unlikely [Trypanosoma brucei gambiense DAL972]